MKVTTESEIHNCKDKIEKTKKTLEYINRLPDDILRKVYDEYFECKSECDEFLGLIESERCQRLKYQVLYEQSKKLLTQPCAVEYLRKKNAAYNSSYEEHFINKRHMFQRIPDIIDSFNLAILMMLYH